MIYKSFFGKKISSLGMGGMRFPTLNNNYGDIDFKAVEEMFDYAIKNGLNYFDTAYGYHSGNSEKIMGEILKKYPRDSFYLADKFPGYSADNLARAEEIFNEQLKKCQVDYFDFYLCHTVTEENIDMYLDEKYKLHDFLIEQKNQGKIRNLGFSTHGTLDTVKRFVNAYSNELDFCQIQLNWLDWSMQDARAKVEFLKECNIPIFVMEPLRGGKLVNLGKEYEDLLRQARPETAPLEWAFRYLQSFENVVVTLSGMSNLEQVKQNIEIFKTNKPTNENETALLYNIVRKMSEKKTLPCTSCRYCTSECPQELDIPYLIELYNDHKFWGGSFSVPAAVGALDENKKPSACIGCRGCEKVCPQSIKISEMMTDFTNMLKQ